MCLRGLSRPAGAKKFSRNDEKQAENDEDSNNGNKRLTGTNADVVSMHASSEYTGAFRSIHVDLPYIYV